MHNTDPEQSSPRTDEFNIEQWVSHARQLVSQMNSSCSISERVELSQEFEAALFALTSKQSIHKLDLSSEKNSSGISLETVQELVFDAEFPLILIDPEDGSFCVDDDFINVVQDFYRTKLQIELDTIILME